MRYILSGVAGKVLGHETFLIPFFKRDDSNRCFAQELDRNYDIICFAPFEPELYGIVPSKVKSVERTVGQKGILSVLIDGNAVIGEPSKLFDLLKDSKVNRATPFFALDVAMFLGDKRRLSAAVAATADALKRNHRKNWIEQVARIAPRAESKKPPAKVAETHFEDHFAELFTNPQDPEWPARWLREWANGTHPTLVEAALWWLNQSTDGNPEFGNILSIMLRVQPDAALRIASEWLIATDGRNKHWASVFIRVVHKGRDRRLLKSALNYLDAHLHRPKKGYPGDSWMRVWSTLLNLSYELETLKMLALQVGPKYPSPPRFINDIIIPLLKREPGDENLYDIAFDWVTSTATRNVAWARAYAELIRIRRDEMSLYRYGAYAIRVEALPNRVWLRIWRALIEVRPDDPELWDLANAWVEGAKIRGASWVAVALTLLRRDQISAANYYAVTKWLEEHPGHSKGSAVAAAVAENPYAELTFAGQSKAGYWAILVEEALSSLGGEGSLSELYGAVELLATRPLPKTWKSLVRRTLGDFSPSSTHFRGKPRYRQVRAGYWRFWP